jgi:hypothetical protein
MALQNYLSEGTYSIVDCINYSKYGNWLRFTFKIFSDSSKTTELASKNYEICRHILHRGVRGFTSIPPVDAVIGEFYVVTNEPKPTGLWEGREGLLAVLNDKLEWCFWGFGGNSETFYHLQDSYYFLLNRSTLEPIKIYPTNDFRLWDKWFSPDNMFSDTSNIVKQIYLFLKSQPGFENVVDV